MFRDKHIIQLNPDQRGQDLIDTIIHECLHALRPEWTEDTVAQTAEDIAAALTTILVQH